MKVDFFQHQIEHEDIGKVVEVLNSAFLTTGEVTAEFEEKFSQVTGLPHTVGVTSCTAALHLALQALGIGPGDEVITTPMSFLATATAILHAGATPVFADVEPETGLIHPQKIEKVITPKTKAILPVHLYGTMADMKAISAVAKRHGLKIIEDCAHCIEGERDGVRPGQLGDAACYSFYTTKNLTSGEGGGVGTRYSEVAEKVRLLRLHGLSVDAHARYHGKFKQYDMPLLGWKYNMDNIHAALLVHQMDRIPVYEAMRQNIRRLYTEAFDQISGIQYPEVKGKGALHLQTIWVNPKRRDKIMDKLQEKGIGTSIHYLPIHRLKYFRDMFKFKPEDFPEASKIGDKTITLPFYPKLGEKEIQYVIDSLRKIMAECGS